MKALDLSFDAPQVTPAWCAARLADGYELFIVNLWKGNGIVAGAEHALRTWREAGGLTAAYFVVHDSRLASFHFDRARVNAGAEWAHLAFVAIDVEVEPTTAATVRAAADAIAADGLRPVVYTAWWFWHGRMGNPADCADLPLWDAGYGTPPGLAMDREYGGWTRRIGHQHTNTTGLDGIAVDLNVFDGEWVRAGMATPEPEQLSPLAVALAHLAEADRHNAAAAVSVREAGWHIRAARELLTGG